MTIRQILRGHCLTEAKKKHKLAAEAKLKAFMDEWRSVSHPDMFGLGRLIGIKSDDGEPRWMTVDMEMFSGMVLLKWMQVLPGDERKGAAHDVLDYITGLADKHKVQMTLIARPTGKPKIPKGKLKALYRKYGFVSTGGDQMRRDPG